jgi:hypothetical protein
MFLRDFGDLMAAIETGVLQAEDGAQGRESSVTDLEGHVFGLGALQF